MLLLGGFGLASKAHALTESSMKIVEDQGRNEELCAPQASNHLELPNFQVLPTQAANLLRLTGCRYGLDQQFI